MLLSKAFLALMARPRFSQTTIVLIQFSFEPAPFFVPKNFRVKFDYFFRQLQKTVSPIIITLAVKN